MVVAIGTWFPFILNLEWRIRKRRQELTSLRFPHQQATQPEKH